MASDTSRQPVTTPLGGLWFSIAALGSIGGGSLAKWAVTRPPAPVTPAAWAALIGGFVLLVVAGLSAWRLARAGLYAWLLPLAALCLVLLEPGRAGDARTWRLEWGVMGLGWTLAAVLVFARLLRRSDELEQRLHLEGAFYALAFGLVGAVVYALFEPRLPELRGQWVAVALLLAWWLGYLATARRYRWRA